MLLISASACCSITNLLTFKPAPHCTLKSNNLDNTFVWIDGEGGRISVDRVVQITVCPYILQATWRFGRCWFWGCRRRLRSCDKKLVSICLDYYSLLAYLPILIIGHSPLHHCIKENNTATCMQTRTHATEIAL